MSETQKSARSFFTWAAWYAVLAPFIAVGSIFVGLMFEICSEQSHRYDPVSHDAFNMAVTISISSGVASILCLFGVRRHGWRTIVWKSALGLIASSLVFFWVFALGIAELSHQ